MLRRLRRKILQRIVVCVVFKNFNFAHQVLSEKRPVVSIMPMLLTSARAKRKKNLRTLLSILQPKLRLTRLVLL